MLIAKQLVRSLFDKCQDKVQYKTREQVKRARRGCSNQGVFFFFFFFIHYTRMRPATRVCCALLGYLCMYYDVTPTSIS